jgi:hypothetical protein
MFKLSNLVIPPWLNVILTYWKPILLVVGVAGIWFAGDYHGHASERRKNEIVLLQMAENARKDHDAMQAALDKAADDFEHYRTSNDKLLDDAESELQNEISKNPAYGTCHVGAGFMQSYSNLATGHP